MKKSYWYIAGAIIITYLIMGTNKAFGTPTKSGLKRGCDPKGCGHFGASRGTRKHMGVDFVTLPNEPILAPISGKVTALPYASSDLIHRGIEIISGNQEHQLFYLKPIVKVGQSVSKGQIIGYADDIRLKYGSTMTNHVHHEVKENGKFIDPTKKY
jgi:murein DD-endopeptidase MepM/ murein hydrolase activator NlpD